MTEIGEGAFAAGGKARSANYSDVEDVLLVRAWGMVGMDATIGTDQTGTRLWQHIDDIYCKIKPKT